MVTKSLWKCLVSTELSHIDVFYHPWVLLLTLCVCLFFRDEQPRGAGAGGARLQDAVSTGLPHLAARADAAVLEEGRRGAAHLRVPAGLPRGLLHSHWASVPARGQPLKPPSESSLSAWGGRRRVWGGFSFEAVTRISAVKKNKLWSLPSPGLYFRDVYSFLSSTQAFQFQNQKPSVSNLPPWCN